MSDEKKPAKVSINPNVLEAAVMTMLFQATMARMAIMAGTSIKLSVNYETLKPTVDRLIAEIREVYNSPHTSSDERFSAFMARGRDFLEAEANKQIERFTKAPRSIATPGRQIVDALGNPIKVKPGEMPQ